jgi:hypothetical protein
LPRAVAFVGTAALTTLLAHDLGGSTWQTSWILGCGLGSAAALAVRWWPHRASPPRD